MVERDFHLPEISAEFLFSLATDAQITHLNESCGTQTSQSSAFREAARFFYLLQFMVSVWHKFPRADKLSLSKKRVSRKRSPAVPSLRPALWFIVIYGLMVPHGLSAAAPSMDTLLPKTTVGFVSATNSIRLTDQWNKTQLGKLMANPVMKPFEEDLRAEMQAQWSTLAESAGDPPRRFARRVYRRGFPGAHGTAARHRGHQPAPGCHRESCQCEGPLGQGPRGSEGWRRQRDHPGDSRNSRLRLRRSAAPEPAGGGRAGGRRGRGRDRADGLFSHRKPIRGLRRPGRRAGDPCPAGQRAGPPAAFPRSPRIKW